MTYSSTHSTGAMQAALHQFSYSDGNSACGAQPSWPAR